MFEHEREGHEFHSFLNCREIRSHSANLTRLTGIFRRAAKRQNNDECFASGLIPETGDSRGNVARNHSSRPELQLAGRRHRAAFIFAGYRIPANPQHFHEHAQAVAKRIQPRSFAMGPDNRNFLRLQAGTTCQKENLRIESPALDLLEWKNLLCSASSKRFESALCVREAQAKNNAQRQVEDASKSLPVERLT